MEYRGEDNLQTMLLAQNYNLFLLNLAVQNIKQTKAQNIVDFGAGNGFFARNILKMLWGGVKLTCVENANNMQKYYQSQNDVCLCKNLDEIENDCVDFLYSYNVLEHIEDDSSMVSKFYQKLKSKGVLLLYLPAFSSLWSNMDNKVGHYRRYEKKALKQMIRDNGFEILDCRYADFAGFFATLVYKLQKTENGNINPKALVFFDRVLFPLGRIADFLTAGKICGKNIILIAQKP